MIDKKAEIIFNKEITPNNFLMSLHCPEIVAGSEPGQFVMIRINDSSDPLLRRPFSICGIEGNDLFMILYRVVGKGTTMLSETSKGQRLSVLGPLGRGFKLPEPRGRSILVAGGIGIAPMIFLARRMEDNPFKFLLGFRTADELFPMEQMGLSDPDMSISTDDGTVGHKGMVTELLDQHLDERPSDKPVVFACGPSPMLRAVSNLCSKAAVECQVSLEATMACGLGACQGCAVNAAPGEKRAYLHVCQDGPVFDAKSIDWDKL